MSAPQATLVLPGDHIALDKIPSNPKQPLRLGPGLRHIPPSTVVPTQSGALLSDPRKSLIWVEQGSGRYIPTQGDLIIGTVNRSTSDFYHVQITDYTPPAILPHLSFEYASKKNRPNLPAGSLVYARVSLANKHMDPELECVNPGTGKADGLGPLVDGMLFNISQGMARRLLLPNAARDGKIVVFEALGAAGLAFETAIGRNGKLWVNSDKVKTTIVVGKAVMEIDRKNLDPQQQEVLVKKLIKLAK